MSSSNIYNRSRNAPAAPLRRKDFTGICGALSTQLRMTEFDIPVGLAYDVEARVRSSLRDAANALDDASILVTIATQG